jgi:hypothetical protein
MTRSQFRLLVVTNQLLILVSVAVQEVTDKSFPPELKSYLGIDESVLSPPVSGFYGWNWVTLVIILAGVIASIGLCFGKRWGRELYLLTFLAALFTTLMGDLYVDTTWTVFVSYLVGTTEGMILGLAYFSHIKRMFQHSEEEFTR